MNNANRKRVERVHVYEMPRKHAGSDLIRARLDRMELALRQARSDLDELRMLLGDGPEQVTGSRPPVDYTILSSRELEIVRLLLQGRRVPQIAGSLFLSTNTIRSHLKSVFRKFDVHSQGELIELLRADA